VTRSKVLQVQPFSITYRTQRAPVRPSARSLCRRIAPTLIRTRAASLASSISPTRRRPYCWQVHPKTPSPSPPPKQRTF
ncbi:hypothetical protein CTA1_5967, partial [Colletotrichum tanaceti]